MGVVRCLPSVVLTGLAPAGIRLLSALDLMAQTIRRDLTVTCGLEAHTEGAHPRGEALDVRTRDLSEPQILVLVDGLKKVLGRDFTVLYEVPTKPVGALAPISFVNAGATGPHLHLQLKKGFGKWPPEPTTTGLTA